MGCISPHTDGHTSYSCIQVGDAYNCIRWSAYMCIHVAFFCVNAGVCVSLLNALKFGWMQRVAYGARCIRSVLHTCAYMLHFSPWMRAYASHSCMRHALYADHHRMQPYAAGPCMQSCIRIAFTCIQAPAAFTRIRSRVAYGRLHMHPICIQGRLRAHPRMYASAYECKCYQLDAGVCRQSPLRLLKYPSSLH